MNWNSKQNKKQTPCSSLLNLCVLLYISMFILFAMTIISYSVLFIRLFARQVPKQLKAVHQSLILIWTQASSCRLLFRVHTCHCWGKGELEPTIHTVHAVFGPHVDFYPFMYFMCVYKWGVCKHCWCSHVNITNVCNWYATDVQQVSAFSHRWFHMRSFSLELALSMSYSKVIK